EHRGVPIPPSASRLLPGRRCRASYEHPGSLRDALLYVRAAVHGHGNTKLLSRRKNRVDGLGNGFLVVEIRGTEVSGAGPQDGAHVLSFELPRDLTHIGHTGPVFDDEPRRQLTFGVKSPDTCSLHVFRQRKAPEALRSRAGKATKTFDGRTGFLRVSHGSNGGERLLG